jgi:hypothetical protein
VKKTGISLSAIKIDTNTEKVENNNEIKKEETHEITNISINDNQKNTNSSEDNSNE